MSKSKAMEDYLKKYLSPADGGKVKKKKKRKKNPLKGNGMQIIDDDVRMEDTFVNSEEEDVTKYMTKEEKPQVVNDDEDAYKDESRWKKLGQEGEGDDDSEDDTHHYQRHDSDSDLEIARPTNKKRYDSDSSVETPKVNDKSRHHSDSDMDLPRSSEKQVSSSANKRRHDSDSEDLDLPRDSKAVSKSDDSDSDLDDIRSMSNKKQGKKMQDGGTGGLISLNDHKKEIAKSKRTESELHKLAQQFKNSTTKRREKGTGELRDTTEEDRIKEEKEKKRKKKEDQYAKWGKGLKQAEMHEQLMVDTLHEESKPLARYRDDEDLDRMLREEIHEEEDPMAQYIMKKREKKSADPSKPALPKYRGPQGPPNRYNILPGYRWDGVNRSNGFEGRYFVNISETAQAKQAYHQWAVNDM